MTMPTDDTRNPGPGPAPQSETAAPGTRWDLYGFDAAQPVHHLAGAALATSSVTLASVPAMSANLLVVSGADIIFADSFD